MTETFVPSQSSTTKKWYVIDANEQILGRLASKNLHNLDWKK